MRRPSPGATAVGAHLQAALDADSQRFVRIDDRTSDPTRAGREWGTWTTTSRGGKVRETYEATIDYRKLIHAVETAPAPEGKQPRSWHQLSQWLSGTPPRPPASWVADLGLRSLGLFYGRLGVAPEDVGFALRSCSPERPHAADPGLRGRRARRADVALRDVVRRAEHRGPPAAARKPRGGCGGAGHLRPVHARRALRLGGVAGAPRAAGGLGAVRAVRHTRVRMDRAAPRVPGAGRARRAPLGRRLTPPDRSPAAAGLRPARGHPGRLPG